MRKEASQGFQKKSDKAGINVKGAILVALWRIDGGQSEDGDAMRRDRQDVRVLPP